MSKEALAKVVQRAISDGAFRRQLSSDPSTALRGFDLSADETAAIRSGDSGRLSSLGVDLRMSKAFSVFDSATSSARDQSLSNDPGASHMGASTTVDAGAAGSSALTSGEGANSDALIVTGDNSGRDSAITGADPAHALGAQIPNDNTADGVITLGDNSSAFGNVITSGDNSGTFGNVLTSGDNTADGVLVVDDEGNSGGVTPGEASSGPSIQE